VRSPYLPISRLTVFSIPPITNPHQLMDWRPALYVGDNILSLISEAGYPRQVCRSFPDPFMQTVAQYRKMSHQRFLPHCLEFIIHSRTAMRLCTTNAVERSLLNKKKFASTTSFREPPPYEMCAKWMKFWFCFLLEGTEGIRCTKFKFLELAIQIRNKK
jgi:hypothetical protein